jgi:hypothetical protein
MSLNNLADFYWLSKYATIKDIDKMENIWLAEQVHTANKNINITNKESYLNNLK